MKSILRLAGVPLMVLTSPLSDEKESNDSGECRRKSQVDFEEADRRVLRMDVYTGEYIGKKISD